MTATKPMKKTTALFCCSPDCHNKVDWIRKTVHGDMNYCDEHAIFEDDFCQDTDTSYWENRKELAFFDWFNELESDAGASGYSYRSDRFFTDCELTPEKAKRIMVWLQAAFIAGRES
jgi:hypothetical protein